MLLRTRFYIPPLRPNGVMRAALLAQLRATGGGALILVSAPAGYGKTTLVSQWLHAHPHQFAWLTLGQEHNAPAIFWQYLVTALQQVQPDIGSDAQQHLQNQIVADPSAAIISLLNDLDHFSVHNRATDPITLVLDDFHLLKNPALLAQINLLLDHLPPCLRIVLTTREEPDLSLPRRRASGQLLQIGVEALRFSADESAAFFQHTMALPASREIASRFCSKTEGWIAGLQLAAISLRHNQHEAESLLGDEGLDRHVADYLLEEVFAGLEPPLQDFLVQTALVKRFCAGLCNAITGRHDSRDVLAQLESAHLFLLPLDNHRTWFRYHDLFRQFLLAHLRHQPAGLQVACSRQATQWLENNGHYDDAIELCLEQKDWPAAVRLLTLDVVMATATAPDSKWQRWLNGLPAHVLAQEPRLCALQNAGLQAAPVAAGMAAEPDPGRRILPHNVEPLTRQEKAVLDLITQGLPNKKIADQLHVSLNTLKVHIRNLYGKMGVENRTQALLRMKGE